MDERRLEIKVGALVLVGVAGVLGLLFLMGELRLGRDPAVNILFSHTGNVVRGAPVKLGGVTVGRVESIELEPNRRDEAGQPLPVRLAVSVEPFAMSALKRDTGVTVATVGPLGEPYLELHPGSKDAPPLEPGATLRGTDAPRLDLVALQLSRMLDRFAGLLDQPPEGAGELVGSVTRLTRNVDVLLEENREEIGTLAKELSAAAKDMRALAATAREAMEPGGRGDRLLNDATAVTKTLRRDVPVMTEDARRVLGQAALLSGEFTEEDMRKLKLAIDRYTAAGEKLESIATRGETILKRVEPLFDPDAGTLGALAQDRQLYDDIRALVSELRKNPWKILWKD